MSTEMNHTAPRRGIGSLAHALAVAGVIAWIALAPSALADGATTQATQSTTTPKLPQSATLEQCITSANPAERSATFAGEMAAIPGATKLEMKIEVLERLPRELAFHAVAAPGLGVWRIAAPGVKTYRYLKEVTNLSAPAAYRAAVRFRWLNAKGKLVRSAELKTPRCVQTVGPSTGHRTTEEPASVTQ